MGFVISYILSIIFLMVGIGWLVVCGSRNKVTYSFMATELMLIIWLLGQLFIMGGKNNSVQLHTGYYMSTAVVCVIGSLWLYFSLCFAKHKIKIWEYIIILGVPIIHILLLCTNNLHFLFYSSKEFVSENRKVFFWTNVIYTYGAMVTGLAVIWLSCLKKGLYKKALSFLITLAVIAPLVLNFLFVFDIIESTMDLTPIAFTFSSLIMLIATRNFGFLNINGMALDRIFDEINQGIIVYTINDEISYCNKQGEKFKNIEHKNADEWEINIDNNFYSVKRLVHYNSFGKGVAYSLVISDVTRFYELIKKNSELGAAKAALQAEQERTRIAQQLHDTIGHALTKIKILAGMKGIASEDYTSQIEEIAAQGITELRESVNAIKNNKPMLMSDALKPLLQTKGININLTVQGQDGSKYMHLTDVVYQSVREAITNALKYSNAENMDIILRFKEKKVEVFVFDDGDGCESINFGNGLTGIRDRVNAVKGIVEFSSILNEGFRITIKLPLDKADDKND